MRYDALQQVAKYNRTRRQRKKWYSVLTGLAAVVVFFTVYALMLPAITEHKDTYCGIAEHKHDDSCYHRILTCTAHKSKLICTQEEQDAHAHGAQCYEQNLICSLAESETHIHTEECVHIINTCACFVSEHDHNEQCFVQTEQLICGIDISNGHTHGDGCYDSVLTCSAIETQGHKHSDTCYSEQGSAEHSDTCYRSELICTVQEHTHTLICSSDPNADLEDETIWEHNVPQATGGTLSERLIAVARSQLGYRESERNYIVAEDGSVQGYSRYGAWYGENYGKWNAMFVSFCMNYAGADHLPIDSDCESWIEALSDRNLYKKANVYSPQAGDVIFFDYDGNQIADHVGIIERMDQSITTIEGDVGNCVDRLEYASDDQRIVGYMPMKTANKTVSLTGNYTSARSANNLRTYLTNSNTTYIKLTANISTSNVITLPNNCNKVLDLNGYTLTFTGSNNAALTLNSGTLTIWDSKAKTETVTTATGDKYGRAATLSTKTLSYYVTETQIVEGQVGMTEETLMLHTVTGAGCIKAGSQPIVAVKGGTLDIVSGMLYGGTNRAINVTKGTVELNGGYICGFTRTFSANVDTGSAKPADEFGGAIYVADGTVNCNGTVIAANTAASGGAICMTGGKLNITGGIISGNTAKSVRTSNSGSAEFNGGGAIYAHNTSVVTMTGGMLTNNIVTSDDSYWDGGGAIFLDDSANFTLEGGYLTGNIAHGGGAVRTGWNSSSLFTMNGGFLTGNASRKAEGGALFLGMEANGADDVGGAIITAGYVTNNQILQTEHWGGGGLFCSDGASLTVSNMLVKENTAAGFGGGLAGCSTGHIFMYSENGCAIYNNEDCIEGEPHFSGDASDKPYDKIICDETFQSYEHSDYFCALESAISNDMLGGNYANWSGSADGVPLHCKGEDVVSASVVMGLTSHPTEEAIKSAEETATLYITGNHSDTHGGGILCNGVLKIGTPSDFEIPVRLLPDVTKLLVDGNGTKLSLEEFEFTAVITDELGNVVSTAKSQPDGTFLFDNEIVLSSEGTYTFYLNELNDGKYKGIQYDTNSYRITVKVIKGEPVAIDKESAKVYYYTTLVTMDRLDTDGSWTNICTINGSHCGSVILPLFGDAYAFTNIKAEKTSIQVVKKWDTDKQETSVDVALYRNGTEIDRKTLSDANNWTYLWPDLPLIDNGGNIYTYTVQEVGVSGYYAEYITTSGGSTSEIYWVPATELVEGERYIIVSPDGKNALYATDNSIDAAYTTADKMSVTVAQGTLNFEGNTYSKWIVGDVDRRAVYTPIIPSDLSQKGGNKGFTLENMGTSSSSWMLVQESGGNYLKGTNNVTYCSIMLIQNGKLMGHTEFGWTPNNLRTVVYENGKFTTATSDKNAVAIYRKVSSITINQVQTITIVNTPTENIRFSVDITKVSEADQSPMPGSELVVLDKDGNRLNFTEENGVYTYSPEENIATTTTVVTDENGQLKLEGLPPGTYTIVEVKPQPNHVPMEDFEFTLGDDNTKHKNLLLQTPIRTFELPETGGIGTMWYTLGGLLLITAALFLSYKLIKQRKEDIPAS